MQKLHTRMHSTMVLQYLSRDYNEKLYDDTIYPPLEEVPRWYTISCRNEWMVDQADVVVTYVDHGWGGAAKTPEYAKRKKTDYSNKYIKTWGKTCGGFFLSLESLS